MFIKLRRILDCLSGLRSRPEPLQDFGPHLACFNFIHFAAALDQELIRSGRRATHAYSEPHSYTDTLAPGLLGPEVGERETKLIDPRYVIGVDWRGHQLTEEPFALMDRLNDWDGGFNHATVAQMSDVPIYVSYEGKNRVSLFRRYGREVRAKVTYRSTQPSLEVGTDRSGTYWLAAWQDGSGSSRRVERAIPYPSVSLPVYKLAGIEVEPKQLGINEQDAKKIHEEALEHLAARYCMP